MAAISNTMGFATIKEKTDENTLPIPVTIGPIFDKTINNPPIPLVIFPIIISTGPNAAIRSAIVMMVFLVPSSMLFNLSTIPCIQVTMSRITGMSTSPIEMNNSSIWLFKIVSCPARLSCMTSAICSAAPFELSSASCTISIVFTASSASISYSNCKYSCNSFAEVPACVRL